MSENKEKLSVEEFKSYSNQLSIINAIIKEYDGEENVDKIMKLLDDVSKILHTNFEQEHSFSIDTIGRWKNVEIFLMTL